MSNSEAALVESPSPSVREIATEDGAVLLDIRQRLCLGLTPVAAEIWRLVKDRLPCDAIIQRLTQDFDVPRDVVAQDVHDLLSEFVAKGLLTQDVCVDISLRQRLSCTLLISLQWPLKISNQARPRVLTFKAFMALLLFDLAGLADDFVVMQEFIRRWTVRPVCPEEGRMQAVCAAVNRACVWYPKRVLCLQRSAVTTCLLRNAGIAAKMVMGAQKMPFRAHAWTEVDGKPVNERRNVQKFYLVWERG